MSPATNDANPHLTTRRQAKLSCEGRKQHCETQEHVPRGECAEDLGERCKGNTQPEHRVVGSNVDPNGMIHLRAEERADRMGDGVSPPVEEPYLLKLIRSLGSGHRRRTER